MFIDIPKHRQDLWKKFHPDNYPVWSYRRGEGEESVLLPFHPRRCADPHASYYQGGGFPISKEGRLKFGFRGRKVS
jgi:sarcosine oxidase/L-pipecolate oxidase